MIGFPQELFTVSVAEDGSIALLTEASSLGPNWLQRIYPDACDIGFVVKTKRGNAIQYVAGDREMDSEGDVVAWTLVPSPEAVRAVPACRGTSVVVFND
jgi:hypothetical protein